MLLLAGTLRAQQAPWSNLPTTKNQESAMGEAKRLHLKLDTLVHEKNAVEHFESFYFEKKTWYNPPTDKIGYGYVTADGKPFGIWRYYTFTGGKYALFCEGAFQNLEASNLFVDEELSKHYTTIDKEATKQSFMSSLEQKAFFTGEWRFYKNSKLDQIIFFDKKVKLPIQEIEVMVANDTSGRTNTQLIIAHPEKIHLAGTVISTIHFSPEGLVTSISANGVNLTFTKKGKPVVQPLAELPFID
jgi:hypothetical protein